MGTEVLDWDCGTGRGRCLRCHRDGLSKRRRGRRSSRRTWWRVVVGVFVGMEKCEEVFVGR